MNRENILEEYVVDTHGIIRSPGKFEGEMLYAPYYYELFILGEEDALSECGQYFAVKVNDAERIMFPEIGDLKYACYLVRDNGFVEEVEEELLTDLLEH